MKQIENAVLLTAFPSLSKPTGAVMVTAAVRASARAVSARTPSRNASNSTGASEKLEASAPSATNASASSP